MYTILSRNIYSSFLFTVTNYLYFFDETIFFVVFMLCYIIIFIVCLFIYCLFIYLLFIYLLFIYLFIVKYLFIYSFYKEYNLSPCLLSPLPIPCGSVYTVESIHRHTATLIEKIKSKIDRTTHLKSTFLSQQETFQNRAQLTHDHHGSEKGST